MISEVMSEMISYVPSGTSEMISEVMSHSEVMSEVIVEIAPPSFHIQVQ